MENKDLSSGSFYRFNKMLYVIVQNNSTTKKINPKLAETRVFFTHIKSCYHPLTLPNLDNFPASFIQSWQKKKLLFLYSFSHLLKNNTSKKKKYRTVYLEECLSTNRTMLATLSFKKKQRGSGDETFFEEAL